MSCNLSYLNHMSGGNKSFVCEMIRLFLIQAPRELEKLQQAVTESDLEQTKQIAHKLKSSVAMIGADGMTAELKILETMSKPGAEHIVFCEAYSRLEKQFAEVRHELEPMLH